MKSKKKKFIVGQNCNGDLHLLWRAARAAHFVIYVTILIVRDFSIRKQPSDSLY